MKSYNNLFEKIITFKNFKKAYKNATKGKKYYAEVKYIERRGVDEYLKLLLLDVIDKKYKVSEYTVFERYTGQKLREIYKLPMRDRIVLHALMNVIEPIFRETFIVDTFSSIKYRGIHLGLYRVKKAIKTGKYKYYLKLDIHKCYPSLDKNILKQKIQKKFKDPDLRWLLFEIIDSCENGIPIGNYTSQYFNNFYFSDFDHWIKEQKRRSAYFRYCDDMVILGETKQELHLLLSEIKYKIKQLNVSIKDNYQIYSIEKRGVDFLGYVVYSDHVRIRKITKLNFINKISKMNMTNLTKRDINVLGSYWGMFIHADCRHLWLKYTNMKSFKDLNINVHDRAFVRDLLYLSLTIHKSTIIQKKGVSWIKFECSYSLNDNENIIYKDHVIVCSSGEKLVEAGKWFKPSDFPFLTTIQIDNNGFYEFV